MLEEEKFKKQESGLVRQLVDAQRKRYLMLTLKWKCSLEGLKTAELFMRSELLSFLIPERLGLPTLILKHFWRNMKERDSFMKQLLLENLTNLKRFGKLTLILKLVLSSLTM